MEFKMNNRTWEIKTTNQEEIMKVLEIKDKNDGSFYHGACVYHKQVIYLWDELCEEQKRKTLIHELGHCYIGNYVNSTGITIDEEFCVELMSNSYDMINEIVKDYFKPKLEIKDVMYEYDQITGKTITISK